MSAMETASSPWRHELGALLRLGIPMGLTQLVQFSINTVDVMMIGRLGAEPLAAASISMVLFYTMWLVGFGPVMAVTPLVSQSLGADPDNCDDVRRSVRMGLWSIALLFPVALVFFFNAGPIIRALGQPEIIAKLSGPYVLALAPGLPFALAVSVLRQFLASIDRTRVPLLVIVLTTVLNAGLNYLLIYGTFGFPQLGLMGAGIASSISHAAGLFALVIYIGWDREARRFDLFKDLLRYDGPRLGEVFRLGWPIGVTTAFEMLLFNSAAFLMGRIGVNEVAAYQVGLNVAALAFMMPLGISLAGCVRVALAEGAGDKARVRRAALLTILISAAAILIVALPAGLFPHMVAGLYLDTANPNNAAVVELVALFLPIAGAFALFDGTQVAANQCLRGLKDVRVPMVMAAISYWVVGFPVAAVLGLATPVGAVGVWWGLLAALAIAAVLLSARLWRLTRVERSATVIAH